MSRIPGSLRDYFVRRRNWVYGSFAAAGTVMLVDGALLGGPYTGPGISFLAIGGVGTLMSFSNMEIGTSIRGAVRDSGARQIKVTRQMESRLTDVIRQTGAKQIKVTRQMESRLTDVIRQTGAKQIKVTRQTGAKQIKVTRQMGRQISDALSEQTRAMNRIADRQDEAFTDISSTLHEIRDGIRRLGDRR